MGGWIRTDDWQWQRKVGDEYEMYQIVDMDAGEHPYFAGGGTFKMEDFDERDVEHALRTYGYDTMDNLVGIYGEDSERVLAECLFESNWADWSIESFDTMEKAQTYVNELMEER